VASGVGWCGVVWGGVGWCGVVWGGVGGWGGGSGEVPGWGGVWRWLAWDRAGFAWPGAAEQSVFHQLPAAVGAGRPHHSRIGLAGPRRPAAAAHAGPRPLLPPLPTCPALRRPPMPRTAPHCPHPTPPPPGTTASTPRCSRLSSQTRRPSRACCRGRRWGASGGRRRSVQQGMACSRGACSRPLRCRASAPCIEGLSLACCAWRRRPAGTPAHGPRCADPSRPEAPALWAPEPGAAGPDIRPRPPGARRCPAPERLVPTNPRPAPVSVPMQVANVAVFLASDAASYITGEARARGQRAGVGVLGGG
jgi:hypothetical protein